MKGALFKGTWIYYNYDKTEIVARYEDYFGISVGDTTPSGSTDITNDINYFTDKVESDVSLLAMPIPSRVNNLFGNIGARYLPGVKVPFKKDVSGFSSGESSQPQVLKFADDCYIEQVGWYNHSFRQIVYHYGSETYARNVSVEELGDSYFGFNDRSLARSFVVDRLDNGIIEGDSISAAFYCVTSNLQSSVFNAAGYVTGFNLGTAEINFWNYALGKYALFMDPYSPGGIAEPGGGDGTFDWESDVVPVQPLPEISVTDAGFVNLYVPTKAQLQNLCRYLWSSAFDIDSLKRIFLEPMDVIIGLSILPITPEEVDADLGTILVGQYSSGISSYVAHRQYVQVDCGTVTIEPKWGAYLDFSPYSKLQLYLPYIGFVDITPDDCMNGTIRVVYNLDILSGACLAQIECTTPGKDGEFNSHVLYEYTGNCSVECPITSGQYRNIISSMFSIASGVVETTATGNPTPILSSVIDTVKGITKPTVSRAGGPGKNTGILGHQAPFLVLTCPRMIIPGRQNEMIGYPSYVTLNLGDLNGYTQIDTIHLFGVPASKEEQDEIVDLLQKGVFL